MPDTLDKTLETPPENLRRERSKDYQEGWPDELRQAYVRKFALAYSITTLAFSVYFTPQGFNPKTAIPVNLGLFLIAAPHWFRRSSVPHYWLNLISQISNAGASVWICSFLGPTSHINLVAIPQFILSLMMFWPKYPKTTWAVGALCFWELLLPLHEFVNTSYLHKRMPEEGLVVLRALLDVTVFLLSTYQFRIISEAWGKTVKEIEAEKSVYQNQNEWRRKLLRILSHDIKEPMVHSLLAARNLKKKLQGEEASVINQIESAQISIREMITNVELSNQDLESAQSHPIRAPMSLHSVDGVLEKLVPWFESRLKEKQVTLDLSCARSEHCIEAASDAFIYQVFMNLLSNAVKFTPTGGTVRVRTERTTHGKVIWSIEDSGVGIGPEAFVSTPVSQVGTAGERGSGLGLKIARSFAAENAIELVWLSSRLPVSDSRWVERAGSCSGTEVLMIQ